MEKYLIVNADDFGLCESINRGIIYAHENGIVNSTSILANGEAFESAVKMAHEHPNLNVGIHLCLIEEKPVLLPEKVRSLTENDNKFVRHWFKFIQRILIGKINLKELEDELHAQIQKVIKTGINPSHIDSHQHIHLLSPILKIIIKLANQYNIKRIRLPIESFKWGFGLNKIFLFFAYLVSKKLINENRAKFTHKFYGLAYSGNLSEERLMAILKSINEKESEIICHPGYEGIDTTQYKHWNYHWSMEVKTLCSARVRGYL